MSKMGNLLISSLLLVMAFGIDPMIMTLQNAQDSTIVQLYDDEKDPLGITSSGWLAKASKSKSTKAAEFRIHRSGRNLTRFSLKCVNECAGYESKIDDVDGYYLSMSTGMFKGSYGLWSVNHETRGWFKRTTPNEATPNGEYKIVSEDKSTTDIAKNNLLKFKIVVVSKCANMKNDPDDNEGYLLDGTGYDQTFLCKPGQVMQKSNKVFSWDSNRGISFEKVCCETPIVANKVDDIASERSASNKLIENASRENPSTEETASVESTSSNYSETESDEEKNK